MPFEELESLFALNIKQPQRVVSTYYPTTIQRRHGIRRERVWVFFDSSATFHIPHSNSIEGAIDDPAEIQYCHGVNRNGVSLEILVRLAALYIPYPKHPVVRAGAHTAAV